ncbi:7TM diverse intracellular signaling domain-containing protein [Deltaproteobacteria bacterium TL4]
MLFDRLISFCVELIHLDEKRIYCGFAAFLIWVPSCLSATPVVLDQETGQFLMGKFLQILEDPNQAWSIQQVSSEEFAPRFIPSTVDTPNFGYTTSAFWVRFQIKNSLPQKQEWLLELGHPLIDYIDLYVPASEGTFLKRTSGDRYPFNHREIAYRNHVFSLQLEPLQQQTLYMRFISEGSIQLPLSIWKANIFVEKVNNEIYFMGFYYGLMFVMALYNLFVFFSVRDQSYFYYVLYIVGLSILSMTLNGLSFEYLWPSIPWMSNQGILFILCFTLWAIIRFVQTYLHTHDYSPRLHRVLNMLTGVLILLIVVFPFSSYAYLIRYGAATVLPISIASILAGFLSWRKGYRPASYFLLAWTTFLCGAIIAALREFGVLPVVFLTNYGFQVGSAIEVTLLSLGLADRINTYRKEKFFAQRKALELQQEANEKLEEKVAQRTLELQQKTDELQVSLDNQKALGHKLTQSHKQLEQQNTELLASNHKLADLNSTKEQLLTNLGVLESTHLLKLKNLHEDLINDVSHDTGFTKETIIQALRQIHMIDEIIRPINALYRSEKAIKNRRVLLAETNKKQQIIAKMALGGTGLELDIASTLDEGKKFLEQGHYDMIFLNKELIDLGKLAVEKNSQIRSVFMTSDDAPVYLSLLAQYSFLSNIVSRNDEDRSFTLKNITTTVSKLITQDLFGLEKYLHWGVKVTERPIVSSSTRSELIDEMEDHLNKLGLRRPVISRCAMIVEELLMNAIYDAPTDVHGHSIYNHLPRTITVELKPEEQGLFRYACDGSLLAVSVQDPFGAFHRKTILDYLGSCYEGRAGSLNKNKGGAGQGLFQIIETADLVVFNVKPNVRTEVITIFNIDPEHLKNDKTTSFHYFCSTP